MFPCTKSLRLEDDCYSIQPSLSGLIHSSKTSRPSLQDRPVNMRSTLPQENEDARHLQSPRAALVAQLVKNPPAMRETWV